MKAMTCRQLGGACDREFRADTFEDIAEMSRNHGVEMFHIGDEAHLAAMKRMKEMMEEDGAMERWKEERRREFEALPECE